MDLKLKGKKALVTGSSRGIGKDIARSLSNEGCTVAINGRNLEKLSSIQKEIKSDLSIVGDVTKIQDCNNIADQFLNYFGSIDILICNVGSGKSVIPGNENSKEWQKIININLKSTTNIVEVFQKNLIESKGTIICISSICGVETIMGAPVTYSVSKAALNSYVKSISKPLGKNGVRINAIAPGNILFEGSIWAEKIKSNPVSVNKMLENEVPLGRLGNPKDISSLVCFLASPLSSFITGSIFNVDGGQLRS